LNRNQIMWMFFINLSFSAEDGARTFLLVSILLRSPPEHLLMPTMLAQWSSLPVNDPIQRRVFVTVKRTVTNTFYLRLADQKIIAISCFRSIQITWSEQREPKRLKSPCSRSIK
jgi:hypothetical protein